MTSPVSRISCHLCGKLVLVGGATGQERRLLWRCRRQQTGTGVQLNGDRLNPAHGLAAVDAARVVHSNRFVVIEKCRLAAAVAAGSAAHAGIAPMHSARWHWCVKNQVWGWIQLEVGNWREVESGWERPHRQPGHSKSGVTDDCVARRTCKRAEAAPLPI